MKIPCSYTHTKTISKWLVYTFPSFRVRTDFLTGQSDRQIERRWTILLNQAHFTAHTRTTHTIVLGTYVYKCGWQTSPLSLSQLRTCVFFHLFRACGRAYVRMNAQRNGWIINPFVRSSWETRIANHHRSFFSLSLPPSGGRHRL